MFGKRALVVEGRSQDVEETVQGSQIAVARRGVERGFHEMVARDDRRLDAVQARVVEGEGVFLRQLKDLSLYDARLSAETLAGAVTPSNA